MAIDGRNDALQMELMKKRGDAPGFQKIQSSGTKKNRKFGANESRMVSSDNHDRTTFSLLEDALNLKLWKANTNENYRGAWLGIIFDDWFCPSVDRKKKRFDPICDRVLEGVAGGDGPFSRVFFIGVSRQYIFDSSETMGFGN
ncbi:MAG: hypothetical protein HN423_04535 [Alphaproteobacteria bacterium]|nr:hypothetical protein [Alphaproteobacteria bacterium]